jgi:hypothetical protein
MPREARPPIALPPGLPDAALFRGWGADSLKLYLWLRAHVRQGEAREPEAGDARQGYLEVDAAGAEIEQAIGVSKNTVTKLARDLQELGVATFRADRAGYHFRLGEWATRRASGLSLDLTGEVFYLDALLAASDRPTQE